MLNKINKSKLNKMIFSKLLCNQFNNKNQKKNKNCYKNNNNNRKNNQCLKYYKSYVMNKINIKNKNHYKYNKTNKKNKFMILKIIMNFMIMLQNI